MKERTKAENRTAAVLCLLMAAVLLGLCSRCSPLYPINDWVDANIFFTTGKSMLAGRVLYRDVFDHKGPLLYFLYGLGSLLDRRGFGGVFVLEVLAFAAYLYIGWRTVRLFVPDAGPLWMALPAAAVVTCRAFVWGGGAEEICLPLLAAAEYRTLAFACTPAAQRRPMPGHTVVGMGMLAGCVLWIKFNILGFFIGSMVFLAAVYAARGWWRTLGKSCMQYLGGMAVATVPWLLYFAVNGALQDCWQVYFYDNLFLYTARGTAASGSLLQHMLQRGWWGCYDSPLLALFLAAGIAAVLVYAYRRQVPALAGAVLLPLAGQMLALAPGDGYLVYYFLPCAVWVPLGAMPPVWAAQRHLPAARRSAACAVTVAAALILGVFFCRGASFRLVPRAETPQYRFAAQMEPGAALLNYGTLDGGFYTAAGVLPPCRYFCVTNMPLPEQQQEQDALLRAGGVRYVATLVQNLTEWFPAYTGIDSCTCDNGDGTYTWYLYRYTG